MPISIKEAKGMDDGMPVVGLRGKIKAAFEAKTGTRSGGEEWCLMPLIVADDEAEIRVTWFSPETRDHKSLKGRPIEISARKNKKNQLGGAKIEHREYKGEAQVGITVNDDHLRFLDEEGEEPASAPQTASAPSGKPAAHSTVVSQPKGQTAPSGRHTDLDLIAAVARWSKGLREALDPVDPKRVPVEVLQPLLSTFLIAATSDRSSMTIVPPGLAPTLATPKAPTPKDEDPLGDALDFDDSPASRDIDNEPDWD